MENKIEQLKLEWDSLGEAKWKKTISTINLFLECPYLTDDRTLGVLVKYSLELCMNGEVSLVLHSPPLHPSTQLPLSSFSAHSYPLSATGLQWEGSWTVNINTRSKGECLAL